MFDGSTDSNVTVGCGFVMTIQSKIMLAFYFWNLTANSDSGAYPWQPRYIKTGFRSHILHSQCLMLWCLAFTWTCWRKCLWEIGRRNVLQILGLFTSQLLEWQHEETIIRSNDLFVFVQRVGCEPVVCSGILGGRKQTADRLSDRDKSSVGGEEKNCRIWERMWERERETEDLFVRETPSNGCEQLGGWQLQCNLLQSPLDCFTAAGNRRASVL